MTLPICRFCNENLKHTFVNLGMSPLANSYLSKNQLNDPEIFFPLHTYVCEHCLLVQLEEMELPENIFHDYAYFSSYSDTMLKHAKNFVEMATKRFNLNKTSQIIEVASNDGYLLQFFLEKRIPVLGIEPAENVAKVAIKNGIPTKISFLNSSFADMLSRDLKADLLIGNNVLAHVPNINDFVKSLGKILKDDGVLTLEFPHILELIRNNQFDTIYHEHFSYFSLLTAQKIFLLHDLIIFDVEKILTHGGSLRIFVKHSNNTSLKISENVTEILNEEKLFGLDKIEIYDTFSKTVKNTKQTLLSFLINIKSMKKTIVGYGAPAKANTLLNYCGIDSDFIDYTVDRSPHKQNHFLPGTHIPIKSPDSIRLTKPDYLLIFPWNIKDEIMEQMSYIREWGGKFIIPIPEIKVLT